MISAYSAANLEPGVIVREVEIQIVPSLTDEARRARTVEKMDRNIRRTFLTERREPVFVREYERSDERGTHLVRVWKTGRKLTEDEAGELLHGPCWLALKEKGLYIEPERPA